ncbi:unnamed protein product, partial [Owenia fusiformis]
DNDMTPSQGVGVTCLLPYKLINTWCKLKHVNYEYKDLYIDYLAMHPAEGTSTVQSPLIVYMTWHIAGNIRTFLSDLTYIKSNKTQIRLSILFSFMNFYLSGLGGAYK